jgi:very-short-patch-repair endonuclease
MYFLEKNNIDYIYQKTYYDCISTIGNKLKFDFYLPDYNICVEYDGEQHFKPIDYFGGVESFNRQRERDITKNNYCLENNIKLIRLSFKDYDKIENILNFEIGL